MSISTTQLLSSRAHNKKYPIPLACCLLRICSDPGDFSKRLEELRQDLLSRNYNPKIIQDAFDRVKEIERKEALKKVIKTKTIDTMFTITYHPALSSISSIVKKHHRVMVDEDPRMRSCFPKPSVVAYKRPKNLRDLLVKSKFQSLRRSDTAQRRVGFMRTCIFCGLVNKSSSSVLLFGTFLFKIITEIITKYEVEKCQNIFSKFNNE